MQELPRLVRTLGVSLVGWCPGLGPGVPWQPGGPLHEWGDACYRQCPALGRAARRNRALRSRRWGKAGHHFFLSALIVSTMASSTASALHSQANPFIRFLSVRHDQVGDVGTAGELFKHLWALCNGPTDGLNARCQIFGSRSPPVRPPSGCPLIPLLTPAVPEVWKVASNVPRRASVHRREPRRRSGGQAGRGLLSLVLPVALCLRPRGKPALYCRFRSHSVHWPT